MDETGPALSTAWLSEVRGDQLTSSLRSLPLLYKKWLASQEARIATLPESLQQQARKHISNSDEVCQRMNCAIDLIEKDLNIETAFRLANKGYRLSFNPNAVVFHKHDRSIVEYAVRKYKIGFWKAFMLKRLPGKIFSDSHTLPSQRWQILLLALSLFFTFIGFFWNPGFVVSLVAFLLFFFDRCSIFYSNFA